MQRFENITWTGLLPALARRVAGEGSGRLSLSCLLVGAGLAVACGQRGAPVGHAGDDARDFVEKHRAELQTEIATGSGPRIYDLAILANCQDVPQLSRRLHKRQAEFFTNEASSAPSSGPASTSPPVAGAEARAPVVAATDAEAAERIVRFMQENRDFRCLNLDTSRQRMFSAGLRHIGPRRGVTTARGGTP